MRRKIHCNRKQKELKEYYFDDLVVIKKFIVDDEFKKILNISVLVNDEIFNFSTVSDLLDFFYSEFGRKNNDNSINFVEEKEKVMLKVYVEQAFDLLCWDLEILKNCKIFGEDYNSMTITFDFIEFVSVEHLSPRKILNLEDFIREKLNRYKYVACIPLTISQATRKMLLEDLKYDSDFRDLITCKISEEEYKFLQETKRGGFCGCNFKYKNKLLHNVKSYDIKSMYPLHQCIVKIPCGRGTKVKASFEMMQRFHNRGLLTACKALLSGVELKKGKTTGYIEAGCCRELTREGFLNDVDFIDDYVVKASEVIGFFTMDDLEIIQKFYTIKSIKLYYFWWWQATTITESYRTALLKIFKLKENGDGDAKTMVNLTSGLWGVDFTKYMTEDDDFSEKLEEYCEKKTKLGTLGWYVFLTANCRRRILTMIEELGSSWVYSDTDSIKVILSKEVTKIIDEKNIKIRKKVLSTFSEKQLSLAKAKNYYAGEWCDEGVSKKFFVVGKKQYLAEKNGKIKVTFSGCDVSKAAAWLKKHGGIEALSKELMAGNDFVFPREAGVKTNRFYNYSSGGYKDKPAKYSVKYDAKITSFFNGVVKIRQ